MEEKLDGVLQLNEDYRMTSDGSRNIILQNKSFKRDGVGKHANFTDEVKWTDAGYFGINLHSIIHKFNDKEFLEVFGEASGLEIKEEFEKMRKYLDEREERIYNHVCEHVNLHLKEITLHAGEEVRTSKVKIKK